MPNDREGTACGCYNSDRWDVLSTPPHVLHPDPCGCYEYFQALAAAVETPICIQNYIGPVGTPMAPEAVGCTR